MQVEGVAKHARDLKTSAESCQNSRLGECCIQTHKGLISGRFNESGSAAASINWPFNSW